MSHLERARDRYSLLRGAGCGDDFNSRNYYYSPTRSRERSVSTLKNPKTKNLFRTSASLQIRVSFYHVSLSIHKKRPVDWNSATNFYFLIDLSPVCDMVALVRYSVFELNLCTPYTLLISIDEFKMSALDRHPYIMSNLLSCFTQ